MSAEQVSGKEAANTALMMALDDEIYRRVGLAIIRILNPRGMYWPNHATGFIGAQENSSTYDMHYHLKIAIIQAITDGKNEGNILSTVLAELKDRL